MALWQITTKFSRNQGSFSVSKGLSVRFSSNSNPMYSPKDMQSVNQLFINNYGINLASQSLLTTSFLEIKKIG